MRRTLNVRLGKRSYPVHIGAGIIRSAGRLCRRHDIPERVAVLADRNSAAAALRPLLRSLREAGYAPLPIIFPPGESQKSFRRAELIHRAMLRAGLPRNSALIALGGGVVGDVGGFVASTYRRGIPFVQCPTTLLSQIDSSVGGKNGVNHASGKNAVGSFHQPRFVCADIDFLETLPVREIRSGIGELIKYPFVGDPSLLRYMEDHLDALVRLSPKHLLHVAERALGIKTGVVSRDERETRPGGRSRLNIGHAVGHALEGLSGFRLRHGEAVFLGLIAECEISVRRGWIAGRHRDRLIDVYHRLGCRFAPRTPPPEKVVRLLYSSGTPRFVLPKGFGSVRTVTDVRAEELRAGLRLLSSL